MGKLARRFRRFPLLLKFLEARGILAVQVHPSDARVDLPPERESGKTEAWVVVEAATEARIYTGLKPGATPDGLRKALANGMVADHLEYFTPKPGDAVLVPAGTVHSLGGGVVVFEIQRNRDVTFRLYDWDNVDAKTGRPRALQTEQALACIDFSQQAAGLVTPAMEAAAPVLRERLVDCQHFRLWRLRGLLPFTVGSPGLPRVLVCIEGAGQVLRNGNSYKMGKGEVFLLPAAVGQCTFQPRAAVSLLEIALPN